MLWVMGAHFPCQMMFVALGKAKVSLLLAILRKGILLIPLIYLFPFLTGGKIGSVYLAEPVSDTISAIVATTLFFHTNRQYFSRKNPV